MSPTDNFNNSTNFLLLAGRQLPSFFLCQCDWLGLVLASGPTAKELVAQLCRDVSCEKDATTTPQNRPWTLNYLRMIPSNCSDEKVAYTQRTLLCAVAQMLQEPAALDPSQALDRLILVEESGSCIYLVKIVHSTDDTEESLMSDKWSQRPFPYSSAMNLEAATIVLDTLAHLVFEQRRQQLQGQHFFEAKEEQPPRLLDITCGSGMLLALALERGMQAVGWDSNPACAVGSRKNLEILFGKNQVEQDCQIETRDSLLGISNQKMQAMNVDCITSNLPLGHNTVNGADQIEQLLLVARRFLSGGVPCAFVLKKPIESWGQLGYRVLGQAHIPQRNFQLPGQRQRDAPSGRSDCVVIFVETL